MLNVEFHCHTIYSKDALMTPGRLVTACCEKGIDRVVVTDHNTLAGAHAAQAIDDSLVIVGEEIMTTQGELLAVFVEEEIPAGLPPEEAIRRLREQGAFISVSHPFDRFRAGSWTRLDLERIRPLVDAIEIYNSRCWLPHFNTQARDFAAVHHLAGTVGSDAHAAFELGRSLLQLHEFADGAGLQRVIRRAVSRVRWSPPWFHLVSRYASATKRLRSKLDTQKQA
jgi:hypothetical protein